METTANGIGLGTPAGGLGKMTAAGSLSCGKTEIRTNSTGSGKTKKKPLSYNPKEISSQLLRATKASNATLVLTRAKGKVYSLYQYLGTGQYDEKEVRIAIAHARRMVKCAQLKVKNLKEEEQLKSRNMSENKNGERQKKNKIKQKVRQKEQAIKTKAALEETQKILREKTRRQELAQKRRLHRSEEQGKIGEADMKYMQERLSHQNSSGQYSSGVTMELSMQAMGLRELRLSEHAMKLLEEQIEQEVELEMSGSTDLGTALSGGEAIAAPAAEVSAGAADGGCVSIDVVV